MSTDRPRAEHRRGAAPGPLAAQPAAVDDSARRGRRLAVERAVPDAVATPVVHMRAARRCSSSSALGPAAVAGEVGGHPDPGHARAADGAVAERHRLGEPATAWNDVHIDQYFWNTVVVALGSWFAPDARGDDGRLRAVGAAAALRPIAQRARARDPVRSRRRAARAAVPRRSSTRRSCTCLVNNYLAVWLPAGASAFNVVTGQAVLRQPAARDLRGRPGGRRRAVPAVLVGRAADVAADPRRGVGVRAASRRGRTSSGRCWCCRTPRSSRCRCACRPLQTPTELDVFLAALRSRRSIPVDHVPGLPAVFLRGQGLGGAVKG